MNDPVNVDDATCCAVPAAPALNEPEAAAVAGIFAALADPVRLRLFTLVRDAGEVCSCDLQEPLGRSQPTISHHTKVLADAGLIVGEKRGRWVWWSVAPGGVEQVLGVLGVMDARA